MTTSGTHSGTNPDDTNPVTPDVAPYVAEPPIHQHASTDATTGASTDAVSGAVSGATPTPTQSDQTQVDAFPASAAQQKYLRRIAREFQLFDGLTCLETITHMESLITAGLTSDEASHLIDTRYRHPTFPDTDVPCTDRERGQVFEWAGDKALFGLALTPEDAQQRVLNLFATSEPFFTKAQYRELWRAYITARPYPTPQTPLRLTDIDGIDGVNISEGFFAVFDTNDDLRFYRIYTPTTGTNRGHGVIRRISGDFLTGLYPTEARQALEAIDNEPDQAAYRYADCFTQCYVCGRNLTDPVSRLISVGPQCRGFADHGGLKDIARDVDHNPERRAVYRALHTWARKQGFVDPNRKEDRKFDAMTATRVASAWSGIPNMLHLDINQAIDIVSAATSGNLDEETRTFVRTNLHATKPDTLNILIKSGILSIPVMEILLDHPNATTKAAVNEFFINQLAL